MQISLFRRVNSTIGRYSRAGGGPAALVACLRSFAWSVALFALAAMAAGFLGLLSPQADFLNQFAPLWSLAGLAAAAALFGLSRRRRTTTAVAVLLAAASAVLMGPEFVERLRSRRAPPPHQVRVVQFNVWGSNRTPREAAAWVLAQRADIVVLEEAAGLAQGIVGGLAPHYPFKVTCRGQRRCSTLILSRVAPVASAGLAKGDAENRKALSAAWARYDLGGRSITVFAAHLARPWPWGRQAEDRRQLIEEVRKLPDQNLILVGDFNTTPWTFAGKRQDEALGMRRITRALFTWPLYVRPGYVKAYPMFPVLPIDQAYLRPGLLPVAVSGGPNLGSDHRPVVIDLAWAPLRDQRVVE